MEIFLRCYWPLFFTLLSSYSVCQTLNPCVLQNRTLSSDTSITFFKSCGDSSSYTIFQFNYATGKLESRVNYAQSKPNGKAVDRRFSGNQITTTVFDHGQRLSQTVHSSSSEISSTNLEFLSDSMVYCEYFYDNGNPAAFGYGSIWGNNNPRYVFTGLHRTGKWIEFDTTCCNYWIGNYKPVDGVQHDTLPPSPDPPYDRAILTTTWNEEKIGPWIQYDLKGDSINKMSYVNGEAVEP